MARVVPGAWGTWLPDVELTAAQRTAVEKAVCRALTDAEWGRLVDAVKLYVDGVNCYRQRPRPKIVRKKLEPLASTARRLARLLSEMGDASDNDNQAVSSIVWREEADSHNLDLHRHLWRLTFAAEAGLAKLPADGQSDGRDGDPYMRDLVLAVVSLVAANKPGDDGLNSAVAQVLMVLLTAVKPLTGWPPQSLAALVKAVERARRRQK